MPMLLDHRDAREAQRIRSVLRAGYVAEAALIGARDFQPLRRSVAAIRSSSNTFVGRSLGGTLAAVVELDQTRDAAVEIASLAVDPCFARRGLGSELVRWAMTLAGRRTVTVSTAEANRPAIALYEGLGFSRKRRFTTFEGIACVALHGPALPAEASARRTQRGGVA